MSHFILHHVGGSGVEDVKMVQKRNSQAPHRLAWEVLGKYLEYKENIIGYP